VKTQKDTAAYNTANLELHKQTLHQAVIDWGMGVLDKEGEEKARQIVGPVWEAAGIGVDFGDSPTATSGAAATAGSTPAEAGGGDEMAGLEAAQGKRGDLGEYTAPEAAGPMPGQSISTYMAAHPAGRQKGSVFEPSVDKEWAKTQKAPPEKAVEAQATEGPEKATQDEAAATVAQAPRPWKIIDKSTGRVLGVIDPSKVDAINRQQAEQRAGAYVSGTPENRQGIVEGMTSGARSEGDVELGMAHAEREIGSLDKTDRTIKNHKGGGSVVVPGLVADGVNTKLLNQLDNQARAYVAKAAQNSGVTQLQKRANEMMSVDSMFDSDNPAAQRQAFSSILRSFSGAQVSDRERAFFEQNAGFWSGLNNKLQSYIGGGQLDPTLREDMRKAAAMMMDQSQKALNDIAEEAASAVMNDPSIGGLYKDALGKRWTPESAAAKKQTLKNSAHIDTGETKSEAEHPNDAFDKLGL
jgi:hypothetical protein